MARACRDAVAVIGDPPRSAKILPGTVSFDCRQTSLGMRDGFRIAARAREKTMNARLIRYRTKPEMADTNAELVAAVFAELKAAKPDGVRYLTLRLEDDTFVHIVETVSDDGSSPLPQLAAFKAFQSGVRDRCAEPPLVRSAKVVGNYRMLEHDPGRDKK
jgi:hypothetical protein